MPCSPLAARSAGRGAGPPRRCGVRGAAPCTPLSSGLRVPRAPRPRDRALLASHVATAAAPTALPWSPPIDRRAATANTRFPKNPLSASGQGARRAALPCARKGAERALPLPRTRRALTLTPSLALALAPSPSSSPHPSPNPQGSNQVQGGVRAARPRRPSSALPRGGARATHTRSPPTSPARIQTRSLGLSRGLTPNPNP